MHIVYVTPEFVTETKGGGLASYLSNIATIMRGHGHEVTILTLSKMNGSIIWENGIKVERVKKISFKCPIPVQVLIHSKRLSERLKKMRKKTTLDLIQYASFEAVGFFKEHHIPGVVRISSDCVSWRELKIYDYTADALKRCCLTDRLEYKAIKNGKAVFGPSCATAKIIEKRTGRKVDIVESPFFLEEEKYDYTLFNKLLQGKKYYLSHSSMSCLKGTHLIAEIIDEVCRIDEEAFFAFAGSDHGIFYQNGLVEKMEDYILKCAKTHKDRIIFLGTIERSKLYPVIENAYACLMPSRIDNMPNTCIEAMAMGKIVIGTNGASYEQLIVDGESGFLIEIDDKKGLVDAIQKINLLDEDERIQMCRAARAVTERFAPEQTYEKMMHYYGKIVADCDNRS